MKSGMLEADKVASGLDEMIRFQNFLIRIEAFLQLQTVVCDENTQRSLRSASDALAFDQLQGELVSPPICLQLGYLSFIKNKTLILREHFQLYLKFDSSVCNRTTNLMRPLRMSISWGFDPI